MGLDILIDQIFQHLSLYVSGAGNVGMDDPLAVDAINLHPGAILPQIRVMHSQDFAANPAQRFFE